MQPLDVTDATWLSTLHTHCMPAGDAWSESSFAELLASGAFGWHLQQQAFILARTVADETELLAIVVAPELRRKGWGRHLLAQLRMARPGKIFLEVAEDNFAGLGLYERHGFVQVGRRVRYYKSGQDALVMALNPA
jgi:[ribosomal protein S18]-alanine N-acetyltransferase